MVKVNCPQCRKAVEWEGNPYRPFCMERCKLLDLGKWISEEYRIASDEPADLDDLKEKLSEIPAEDEE